RVGFDAMGSRGRNTDQPVLVPRLDEHRSRNYGGLVVGTVAAKTSLRVMDTAQNSGVRSAEVGALRYLYGDSQPFPGQFNFFATLQGFMECAGRAAKLHHETGELETDLAKKVRTRTQLLEDLTGFCDVVTQHIRERVEQAASPGALAPHASKIVE